MDTTTLQKGAFSVNGFLEWASISRATFYREVNAGRIKTRKLGNKTLVARADADAWLDALPEAA
ncbi:hypothetical protein GCM10007853_30120 [Algimonas ampicilliniresistens]|uniref:DNA-binding protein n=1 Tax=Algimonas ampicilliniresistens TaxID=1298735 RepID=A0ABQ5VCL9_9PROT|nr:hypothetical protein GCM10007853_30120 [Algimonas ampicilliniresistens]